MCFHSGLVKSGVPKDRCVSFYNAAAKFYKDNVWSTFKSKVWPFFLYVRSLVHPWCFFCGTHFISNSHKTHTCSRHCRRCSLLLGPAKALGCSSWRQKVRMLQAICLAWRPTSKSWRICSRTGSERAYRARMTTIVPLFSPTNLRCRWYVACLPIGCFALAVFFFCLYCVI
jgi:hypothetical protein